MKTYLKLFLSTCLLLICTLVNAQAVEISAEALSGKETLVAIAPTLIDEICDGSLSYTVVRMREGADAQTMESKTARFTPEIKKFLANSQPGDAYHFRNLKTECDGSWKDVKSEAVVIKVKK